MIVDFEKEAAERGKGKSAGPQLDMVRITLLLDAALLAAAASEALIRAAVNNQALDPDTERRLLLAFAKVVEAENPSPDDVGPVCAAAGRFLNGWSE